MPECVVSCSIIVGGVRCSCSIFVGGVRCFLFNYFVHKSVRVRVYIPYQLKVRWPKVTKFWSSGESFDRRNKVPTKF